MVRTSLPYVPRRADPIFRCHLLPVRDFARCSYALGSCCSTHCASQQLGRVFPLSHKSSRVLASQYSLLASGAGCASSNLAGGAFIRGDLTAVRAAPVAYFFLRVTSAHGRGTPRYFSPRRLADHSARTRAAADPMITKDFFLTKENYRIGAQILRDHGARCPRASST